MPFIVNSGRTPTRSCSTFTHRWPKKRGALTPLGGHSGRSAYEHVGPEQWLRIAVPALISEEQHALAQELLARNSRLSHETRQPRDSAGRWLQLTEKGKVNDPSGRSA